MEAVLSSVAQDNDDIVDVSEWIAERTDAEFGRLLDVVCQRNGTPSELLTELGLQEDLGIEQREDGLVLDLEALMVQLAVGGAHCPSSTLIAADDTALS